MPLTDGQDWAEWLKYQLCLKSSVSVNLLEFTNSSASFLCKPVGLFNS